MNVLKNNLTSQEGGLAYNTTTPRHLLLKYIYQVRSILPVCEYVCFLHRIALIWLRSILPVCVFFLDKIALIGLR